MYNSLFAPLEIAGKLTLRNRLVMAPMTTVSGELDGAFSSEELDYLSLRAEDGIGLIMTPACFCHKSGHAFERQVGCHTDDLIRSLARCAEAINKHGAASFLQIHHGGNAARSEFSSQPPLAPSAVASRRGGNELPRELTENEIWMIIESFARAAGRAKQAGFAGIELHGANTYLFQQFFSPFTNKRTDKWGGDKVCATCREHHLHDSMSICGRLENRSRFAREVVKAVRSEVGPKYPICYRISPEEPDPDGYSTRDAIELLKMLIQDGIDMVHVSSWEYGKGVRNDYPPGSHPTRMIRDALPREIPVIGVGSIQTPDQAMKVLEDGIDLVALGRTLLLNHDWASKVRSGQTSSIKMTLASEEERQTLLVPPPMREYTRRSIPVS
ncbi:MAG: NADH:flavin oxidoreductase [candidate division Zixibacteria bacterium]|nr:NADH:flavin oxidoreductase [candidate division Zixibacteria bacterium]